MSSDCSDDDMPELESVSSSEVSWLILLYNYIKINKINKLLLLKLPCVRVSVSTYIMLSIHTCCLY